MPRKTKTRANGRKPLARPGDPFVTKDGEVIQPDTVSNYGLKDARPMDVEPKSFRALRRQDMEDLPAEAHLMNACAAVICYTLLGVGDREIQLALNITENQLKLVREHEAYELIFRTAMEELINVNSNSLQARIAGMAHGALSRVADLAVSATKQETKLRANTDILDRAGTKVSDQEVRNQGKPVGLRILITKGGDTTIETSVNIAV